MSTVETKSTIDGVVVEKVDSFDRLSFYRKDRDDEGCIDLYLVADDGKVLRKITVEADCGQNFGYISDVTFSQ